MRKKSIHFSITTLLTLEKSKLIDLITGEKLSFKNMYVNNKFQQNNP